MNVSLLNEVENIVTRGKIACFEHFLLLPQCFLNCCLLQRRQEVSVCVVWLTLMSLVALNDHIMSVLGKSISWHF